MSPRVAGEQDLQSLDNNIGARVYYGDNSNQVVKVIFWVFGGLV